MRHKTLQFLSVEVNKTIPDDKNKLEAIMQQGHWRDQYNTVLARLDDLLKYGLSPLTTPYVWNPDKYDEARAPGPAPKRWPPSWAPMAGCEGPLTALAAQDADAYADQLKQLEPMLTLEKEQTHQGRARCAAGPDARLV